MARSVLPSLADAEEPESARATTGRSGVVDESWLKQ